MKTYKVKWQVQGSVGMPHYQGERTIMAEDEDLAASAVQRNVHRDAFQDISIGRIKIVSTTMIRDWQS